MQILHNLISNAIKFTRSGEVTVSIGGRRDRPLTVEVLDTGIGMTDAQSARIFDDFAQADNSTTRLYGGTGLGMSIVKRIVEAMHGTVSVQSRPGEGTRVRVSLPLEVVEADIAPAAQAAPIAADAPLAIRVLAAEDNVINQMVLSAMLARLGSTVTLVANGAEAVEAWSPGAFDVVLLDVSMPVMDGPTALHRIRAKELAGGHARTPTIAVTANALHHQVEAYLAEGFDGHVAKPIDPASLEATLRRVLRGQAGPGWPVPRMEVDPGDETAPFPA
jgi:CheY-like chemotaxis protein